MGAYVIKHRQMPARMRRHYECLKATRALEQELFGELVSTSIRRQLDDYFWWPVRPPGVPVSMRGPDLPDPGQPERI